MPRRDPGLAAVASFFVWGLGHIYHGRFWAGFCLCLLQGLLIGILVLAPLLFAGLPFSRASEQAKYAGSAAVITIWGLSPLIYLTVWIWQVVAAYRSTELAIRTDDEMAEEVRRREVELARLAAELRRSAAATRTKESG